MLDSLRLTLRLKQYSYRTEQFYVGWIKHLSLFHHKRPPQELSRAEVEAFLSLLAIHCNGAASTQNQALQTLLFLYKVVFVQSLPRID